MKLTCDSAIATDKKPNHENGTSSKRMSRPAKFAAAGLISGLMLVGCRASTIESDFSKDAFFLRSEDTSCKNLSVGGVAKTSGLLADKTAKAGGVVVRSGDVLLREDSVHERLGERPRVSSENDRVKGYVMWQVVDVDEQGVTVKTESHIPACELSVAYFKQNFGSSGNPVFTFEPAGPGAAKLSAKE